MSICEEKSQLVRLYIWDDVIVAVDEIVADGEKGDNDDDDTRSSLTCAAFSISQSLIQQSLSRGQDSLFELPFGTPLMKK